MQVSQWGAQLMTRSANWANPAMASRVRFYTHWLPLPFASRITLQQGHSAFPRRSSGNVQRQNKPQSCRFLVHLRKTTFRLFRQFLQPPIFVVTMGISFTRSGCWI